jgi:quercetin dioxygenase-like cupin family protein
MNEQIRSAQIVVACENLNQTLEFFTATLGFRLKMIFPADSPSTAVVAGFGITLRLVESDEIQPVTLHLIGDFREQNKPVLFENITLSFECSDAPLNIPDSANEMVVSTLENENVWHSGRAGMEYRDLIPSRLGGKFIASHIRINKGGEVPDYVHFHKVHFQMIYCLAGWAKLVYQDQGAPFVMKAGDCVLQPPEIRHRVLECSDAFEVLEIGCPAVHETFVDHQMKLPNNKYNPDRVFSEQRFIHHIGENEVWANSGIENIESCDTGIGEATKDLADVQTLRTLTEINFSVNHSEDFLFFFIRHGSLKLFDPQGETYRLEKKSSFVLPKNVQYLIEAEKGLEMIRVTLA